MSSQVKNNAATVSFVVPCYNERGNITPTVVEIERAAQSVGLPQFEIIAVDDCSSDGTGQIVSDLMPDHPQLKLVTNARNLGFGGAYKEGVKHARLNHVIMIPGDNSYPHAGIACILAEIGKADLVIPYRKETDVRPWYRKGASAGFTSVVNLLFGLHVPYYNGPVVHRADLLRSIEIETDGFAYSAEAIVKLLRRGATWTTVGITILERDEGRSSALKPRTVCGVLKAIVSLRLTKLK